MGIKAEETITCDYEGFVQLLRGETRAFMDISDDEYYITHTDGYWRIQDCHKLNDKGHFTDCSELVPTLPELMDLPWRDGKSLHDLFDEATFHVSVQE